MNSKTRGLARLRHCCTILLLLAAVPLNAATIILVRHAEKAPGTGDVPLSVQGQRRAKALDAMLRDAGVRAIFTTEWVRTQQTAAPLAGRLKIAPTRISGEDTSGLVKKLQSLGDADVALVVGHSNTIPEIAAALGAPPVPEIPETEFDRLLIVRTAAGSKASVLTLRYNTPAS
jgi:phosphohistidine phosphatase SixA